MFANRDRCPQLSNLLNPYQSGQGTYWINTCIFEEKKCTQ